MASDLTAEFAESAEKFLITQRTMRPLRCGQGKFASILKYTPKKLLLDAQSR